MSENTSPDDLGDRPSVEEQWYQVLTDHGADSSAAERVIQGVQTHPDLAFGNPDADRLQELVEHGIAAADFETIGVDDPDDVKEMMVEILRDGLAGNYPGPVSLPPQQPSEGSDVDGDIDVGVAASPGTAEGDPTGDRRDEQDRPESPDADAITVETPETVDNNGQVAPGAVGGAQPQEGGGNDSGPDDLASDQTETEQSQDSDGDNVDFEELDLDMIVANFVIREMAEESFEDGEMSEQVKQIVGESAQRATLMYERFMKDVLFGNLGDTEQDLMFERVIEDRIREVIAGDSE